MESKEEIERLSEDCSSEETKEHMNDPGNETNIKKRYLCTPCQTDNEENKAEYYCSECKKYFCCNCVKFHNKFSNCKKSGIYDKSEVKEWGQEPMNAETNHKCEKHPNKDIEMFCGHHDVVCCHVCVSLDHRSCPNMDYIPSVGRSLAADDFAKLEESSKNIIREAEILQTSKKQHKVTLNKSKEKFQQSISKLNDKYACIMQDLEEKTTREMNRLYNKQLDALCQDVSALHKVKDAMEVISQIQALKMDDSTKFIHFKESQRKISNAQKILLSNKREVITYKFTVDENVENFLQAISTLEVNPEKHLSDLAGLGQSTPDVLSKSKSCNSYKILSAKPISTVENRTHVDHGDFDKRNYKSVKGYIEFNVPKLLGHSQANLVCTCGDKVISYKTNVTQMWKGKDRFKNCWVAHSTDNTGSEGLLFEDECTSTLHNYEPHINIINICNLTENDVAIIFSNGTVIFWPKKSNGGIRLNSPNILYEAMTKKMIFQHDCFCLAYHEGILYITSRDGSLYMYDLGQTLLKKIERDNMGNRCFAKPQFITISSDKTMLYVTDWFKGLVTINISGQILHTFSDPRLVGTCGLTTDIDSNIFVGGYHSRNVVQLNSMGNQIIRVILEDLTTPPFALAYLSTTSCLLVSSSTADDEKVQAFKVQTRDKRAKMALNRSTECS